MASKNIIAKGTTYNGVESVTFPTSPSGTATFYEVSDTTATASDVLNSKYFYTAAGVKTQGTGTAPSPTLITKNITQNGTYNASSDNADGYSSVTVSVSGGGGDSWSWMGKNPTKAKTCLNEKVYFEDTGYATWTPSTTSATIINEATLNAETIVPDEHDAILLYKMCAHFEYSTDATGTKQPLDFYYVHYRVYYGISSGTAAWTAQTSDSFNSLDNPVRRALSYLNLSGTQSYTTSSYGVYPNSAPTPTQDFSNGVITITPKTPPINARCSTTYFTTDNAAAVDQSASYIHQTMELWTVDKFTSLAAAKEAIIKDLWDNGL